MRFLNDFAVLKEKKVNLIERIHFRIQSYGILCVSQEKNSFFIFRHRMKVIAHRMRG